MSLFVSTDGEATQTQSPTPSPGFEASPLPSYFVSGTPTTRSFSNFSTTSNQSLFSNASSISKATSTSTTASRRRGYVRPQGATFAPSAKNRDSVMSLGSIAHLQYYFARTGLLDGRSGQLAKKKENGEWDIPKIATRSNSDSFESPIDEEAELLFEAAKEEGEEIMLPPTVSTYRSGSQYVPPPPSQQTLKRELVESLENALQALEATEKATETEDSPGQGFYEIQGLLILDATTLAIQAARQYYTMHSDSKRLDQIKPRIQLRKDLYDILEVLKQMAARNFAGGLRETERLAILVWVSEVGMIIDQEAKLEEAEKDQRTQWRWMQDSLWINNEASREHHFIDFLLHEAGVPSTECFASMQDKFWSSLVDGKKLIQMHNIAVKKSKRPFGFIEKCHEDTRKPYRRADNIRFWLKAAELRFEVKLKLDVLATVTAAEGSELIEKLQDVVIEWSKVVRVDLSKDWSSEEDKKLHARARSLALVSPLGSPSKPSKTVGTSSPVREEPESPV